MTDDAVTVEVPDGSRADWADLVERSRAAAARFDRDLEMLAVQADTDHQDAEAMRAAILGALDIYNLTEYRAADYDRRAKAAEARNAWTQMERFRDDALALRARAGAQMAERLQALHRVPVESREMTDDEMREAGMI